MQVTVRHPDDTERQWDFWADEYVVALKQRIETAHTVAGEMVPPGSAWTLTLGGVALANTARFSEVEIETGAVLMARFTPGYPVGFDIEEAVMIYPDEDVGSFAARIESTWGQQEGRVCDPLRVQDSSADTAELRPLDDFTLTCAEAGIGPGCSVFARNMLPFERASCNTKCYQFVTSLPGGANLFWFPAFCVCCPCCLCGPFSYIQEPNEPLKMQGQHQEFRVQSMPVCCEFGHPFGWLELTRKQHADDDMVVELRRMDPADEYFKVAIKSWLCGYMDISCCQCCACSYPRLVFDTWQSQGDHHTSFVLLMTALMTGGGHLHDKVYVFSDDNIMSKDQYFRFGRIDGTIAYFNPHSADNLVLGIHEDGFLCLVAEHDQERRLVFANVGQMPGN